GAPYAGSFFPDVSLGSGGQAFAWLVSKQSVPRGPTSPGACSTAGGGGTGGMAAGTAVGAGVAVGGVVVVRLHAAGLIAIAMVKARSPRPRMDCILSGPERSREIHATPG